MLLRLCPARLQSDQHPPSPPKKTQTNTHWLTHTHNSHRSPAVSSRAGKHSSARPCVTFTRSGHVSMVAIVIPNSLPKTQVCLRELTKCGKKTFFLLLFYVWGLMIIYKNVKKKNYVGHYGHNGQLIVRH